MTLLATLTDADLGFPYTMPPVPHGTRTAARAFLFDDSGLMAYVWSATNQQHKLPGGGVEPGEELQEALMREMLEETGCHITGVTYLGYLEEHRGKGGFLQTSHLFTAKVHGPKATPAFDANEQAHGFALKWLPPEEAIRLAAAENTSEDYGLRFQNAREQALLAFLP